MIFVAFLVFAIFNDQFNSANYNTLSKFTTYSTYLNMVTIIQHDSQELVPLSPASDTAIQRPSRKRVLMSTLCSSSQCWTRFLIISSL